MMDKFKDLFQEYELLVAKADQAFQEMTKDYRANINCDIQCSDCCNAVFGLFLIESAYLNHHFNKLDRTIRRAAASKGDKFDKALLELEKKFQENKNKGQALEKIRIGCPLLNDEQKCSLYKHRPITCRVYGIPTIINGQIHACWKAGFKKGESYPAFDLDSAYKELYNLSKRLLERVGHKDMDKASLLVSVSKSIKTPLEDLINEI
ncbi:YkgJ family cysteine cluster protein [Desulfolucanica intricata]|uniref:YkgJ family cysteine cluster protein n=1 Tax=Desulfolucanica intricata TaxID=1285191 RepID=UPI000A94C569|nr:YkgJ family cysteine cluster protein [Desulfolucanica intricata]